MVLPASGSISWQQICAEFSLNPATAVWPTNFYGKGGAPASGSLSFSDFYGRSGGGTYTPAPGSYTYNDNGAVGGGPGASAFITSNSGSVPWTYTISGFGATPSISSGSSATTISFSVPSATGTASRNSTVTLNQGGNTWTLTMHATGQDSGGGLCVACDTPILISPDGDYKLAGELVEGDVVYTRHEITGEWMHATVEKIELAVDTVYRLRGHPDATARHRFGYKLFGKVRWYRAGWFGRKARETTVAKISVMGARTYMARSPKPGSKWRLSHNIKP